MANIIKHKRSSTYGAVPPATGLSQGELGINIADGKLYTKNSSNNIINLGITSISGTTITPATGLFSSTLIVDGTGSFTNLIVQGSPIPESQYNAIIPGTISTNKFIF